MKSILSRREFLKLAGMMSLGAAAASLGLPEAVQALSGPGRSRLPVAGHPNFLILVFDTLSARHLSMHGYERAATPNISRFAERATVFHAHHAAGNFTTPATASMFTGVYPWTHRAINLHGTIKDTLAHQTIFSLLPPEYYTSAYSHNLLVTSLFRQFQEDLDLFKNTRELCLSDVQYSDRIFPADYNTSFWSENLILRGTDTRPSSLFLSLLFKASRFASKREVTQEWGALFPRGVPNLNDLYFVLEDAVDWIVAETAQLPQPFAGYYHFLPPHEPYSARREFVDAFKEDGYRPVTKPEHPYGDGHPQKFLNAQRREYDEYLAYTDSEFGRLMDGLDRSGVLENTYVILTSDHGELFERGIRGHVTSTLFEPVIHVPLVISAPGQGQRQDVMTPTSAVDLAPTLLSLAGAPVMQGVDGQLLPQLGGKDPGERSLFALDAKSNAKYGPLKRATMAMVKGRHKLVHYFGYKKQPVEWELFDLENDPQELEDRWDAGDPLAKELADELLLKLAEVNDRG